jgi:hypothetical protein
MAHDSDPAYVLAAAGTLLSLSLIAVGLLFATRAIHKTKYGVEDYLLLPALVYCPTSMNLTMLKMLTTISS